MKNIKLKCYDRVFLCIGLIIYILKTFFNLRTADAFPVVASVRRLMIFGAIVFENE